LSKKKESRQTKKDVHLPMSAAQGQERKREKKGTRFPVWDRKKKEGPGSCDQRKKNTAPFRCAEKKEGRREKKKKVRRPPDLGIGNKGEKGGEGKGKGQALATG